MRPTCFINGSCDVCGCQTTMLQMANKACDGDCYPAMFSAGIWKYFKEAHESDGHVEVTRDGKTTTKTMREIYPLQNTYIENK